MASGEGAASMPRAETRPELAEDRTVRIAAAVDEWFIAHFYDSPVPRGAEAFTHALAAQEELKRRLIKEV